MNENIKCNRIRHRNNINKKAPVGNLYNLNNYRNIHAEQINNMTNISDGNLL